MQVLSVHSHLRDPFAKPCQVGNALQVGTIGIGVVLKVGLKNADLLLRKSGSDTFRFLL